MNFAFDLLAYTVIGGLGVAFVFYCFVEAAIFMAFACGYTSSQPASGAGGALPTEWDVVASPEKEGDRLCGFSAFEPVFTPLLGASLLILPSLVLMILQNTYLRDPAAATLVEFLADDWAATWTAVSTTAKTDPVGAMVTVVRFDPVNIVNPNIGLGVLTFAFVVAASIGACWSVLRAGARHAQQTALENVDQLSAELDRPDAELRARLNRMEFWPIGWISWQNVATVVLFMAFAIVSYRLAVLPVALALALFLLAFFRRWTPHKPSAAAAPNARPQQPAS